MIAQEINQLIEQLEICSCLGFKKLSVSNNNNHNNLHVSVRPCAQWRADEVLYVCVLKLPSKLRDDVKFYWANRLYKDRCRQKKRNNRRRVLLKKLTVLSASQEITCILRIRGLITVFTRTHPLILNLVQTPKSHIPKIHFHILPSTLWSSE